MQGVTHRRGSAQPLTAEEGAVIRKVTLRLIPLLTLLYFIAFLDRVNVGFAALTMNRDLGLSTSAFGIGAGIFFVGYFLFELPSNLLLQRYGARRWIARIMVSWGLVSMGMAFVTGPVSFWIMRCLLGIAEAGFFPGIVLYLTYWFPSSVRGGIIGLFILANPVTTVIGAPISTALLEADAFGLAGWQTMFIVEGLPAIALGVLVLFALRDSPAQATWLSERERATLDSLMERDRRGSSHHSLRDAFRSADVWRFTLVYAALILGLYGFGFWAPQIIKALGGLSNQQVGWLIVIPYGCAAIAMCLWARHSDRSGERGWHLAIPGLVGAAGFLCGAFASDTSVAIACFTVGAIGLYATLPVFWTVPTGLLAGSAAAGGIALINSFGNLSGYLGPVLMGWLKQSTGGYAAGLGAIAFSIAFGGAYGLYATRCQRRRGVGAAP